MKKLFILLVFHIAMTTPNSCLSQAAEWGNWGKIPCYQGFDIRVKYIGYSKVVNQHEWVAQVKNSYPTKVTFSMYWSIGAEKQNIGQFTVSPGMTTSASSYYFNSSSNNLYVEIGSVCFGADAWCKCKADCDTKPGVPNQLSEEACKAMLSHPKSNEPSSGSYSNNSSTSTNNTNDQAIKDALARRDFKKYPFDANECKQLFPNGHPPPGSGDCIWLNCPCPEHFGKTSISTISQTATNYSNSSVSSQLLNQYNEAQIQNTIRDIQNTPINTFDAGKLEIKPVKKQSPSEVDKRSVASIVESEKIELEFPELLNFKMEAPIFNDPTYFNDFEKYLFEKTIKPKDGKAYVTVEFFVTEKGTVEYINIKTNNEKFIQPVTDAILFADGKWKPATQGGKPFRQKVNFKVNFLADCSDLISYRDNQLLKDFDDAINNYKVNSEALTIIADAKKELIEDTKWETSDAGFNAAAILQGVRTTTDLLKDLLAFHPAYKLLLNSSSMVTKSIVKGVEVYEFVDKAYFKDEVLDAVIDVVLSEIHPVGHAIRTIKTFGENIHTLVTMKTDFNQLKEEVKRAIDNFENDILKYNKSLENNLASFKSNNEIKNAIDNYIDQNCKSTRSSKILLH